MIPSVLSRLLPFPSLAGRDVHFGRSAAPLNPPNFHFLLQIHSSGSFLPPATARSSAPVALFYPSAHTHLFVTSDAGCGAHTLPSKNFPLFFLPVDDASVPIFRPYLDLENLFSPVFLPLFFFESSLVTRSH